MAVAATFESSASISTTARSLPGDTTTGVPTSQTDDAAWQLFLDLNALAAGDEFLLTIYEKVQSAGTQRILQEYTFLGVQAQPHMAFPALMLKHGWDMTLVKVAGTDRTIGWSIREVTA